MPDLLKGTAPGTVHRFNGRGEVVELFRSELSHSTLSEASPPARQAIVDRVKPETVPTNRELERHQNDDRVFESPSRSRSTGSSDEEDRFYIRGSSSTDEDDYRYYAQGNNQRAERGTGRFSSSLSEYEDPDLMIDHNHQVTTFGKPVPDWYIEYPIVYEKTHPAYLCRTCRHIDLEYIFLHSEPKQEPNLEEYIALGSLKDILRKSECGLCRLVAGIARLEDESYQIPGGRSSDFESREMTGNPKSKLGSKYYLTPCVYTSEYTGDQFQVFLRRDIFEIMLDNDTDVQPSNTSHLLPSHPLGIRLLLDEPKGGRRVPRGHMDFAWVQQTLKRCEFKNKISIPTFPHRVRALDVHDFCIVDLHQGARYVALSYPWGRVKQVKLSLEKEADYRTPGKLFRIFSNLPQTIQDAVIFVQKIEERYLWVDSLCIIQDDKEDMEQQMNQMGDIYRGSLLTVHAAAGHDAGYGIPGVRLGTRKNRQIIEQIGNLDVANTLPWLEECGMKAAWSTRGWTYQERVLSQRHLIVGDRGVIFNCVHVTTPEDEQCYHSLSPETVSKTDGHTLFYAGLDKRCKPYIRHETDFDLYAIMMSEYSQRHLTFQTDAGIAFLGILQAIERLNSHRYTHGVPLAEIDAFLLWSPIGSSVRRCDPTTGKFLFASWNWLGWIGHAAWPWTLEREYFVSTEHSNLEWHNANELSPDPQWFTLEDLCLPPSAQRGSFLTWMKHGEADHLELIYQSNQMRRQPNMVRNAAVQWPGGNPPKMTYLKDGSQQLCFRALCAFFNVESHPYRRKSNYNITHKIFRLTVLDAWNHIAGYIDIPDPASLPGGTSALSGRHEFVALSRSTIGEFEPGPDKLEKGQPPILKRPQVWGGRETRPLSPSTYINDKGHFDSRVYSEKRLWCLFNVMMIEWKGNVAYRLAIGRIHVDAFLYAEPLKKVVHLE